MKSLILVGTALCTVLGLSACGNTRMDRALSGAGIGAAGGTAIGVIAGGPILGAAAVGGAAGAVTGALTGKDQINLGKPLWK